VVLRLSVPVVDETRQHMAWNKTALMAQLILAPCVLVWSVLLHRTLRVSPANTYLAYGVSLVLGGMAAAIVNVTSRRNQPPGYQRLTAVVGFITALCWIYILAVELVHALQALARVFDVTDAFVGLTILGPSQSLADLITNVTLARGGMPLMAAAACIAAPLLDILFGVGLAGLLGNWVVAAPFPLDLNVQLYVTGCFLVFALVSMITMLTTNGGKAGMQFGVMLLIVFAGFCFTVCILEIWFGTSFMSVPL